MSRLNIRPNSTLILSKRSHNTSTLTTSVEDNFGRRITGRDTRLHNNPVHQDMYNHSLATYITEDDGRTIDDDDDQPVDLYQPP